MDQKIVNKAALLIRYGLDLKKYNKSAEYKTLAAEYRAVSTFRETVDSVADGLGLKVADSNEAGIVLAIAEKDTPFAPNVTDIDSSCGLAEHRQMTGICLAAIAAVAYQRPGSMLSDTVQSVSVHDVEDKLSQLAQQIVSEGKPTDTKGVNGGIFEASQHVLRISTRATNRSGRASQGTLRWHLERVFRYLEEQKLVKRDGDQYGGEYKTLSRFRAMLANGGANDAVTIVRQAIKDAAARATQEPVGAGIETQLCAPTEDSDVTDNLFPLREAGVMKEI